MSDHVHIDNLKQFQCLDKDYSTWKMKLSFWNRLQNTKVWKIQQQKTVHLLQT